MEHNNKSKTDNKPNIEDLMTELTRPDDNGHAITKMLKEIKGLSEEAKAKIANELVRPDDNGHVVQKLLVENLDQDNANKQTTPTQTPQNSTQKGR